MLMLLPRLCPQQPYLMGAVVVNSVTTGASDLLVTHTHSRVVAATPDLEICIDACLDCR